MRPDYNGSLQGFSPDKSEIIPTCEENYTATKAIVQDAVLPRIWIRDNGGDTGAEPSTGYPWESPDISTVPADLIQNTTVDLPIHVNNATGAAINNVTVDAYYNDPRISLEFPNPISTHIGTATVNVPAGGTDIVMPWVVPSGTNSWGERHWCVGAVLKQDDDMPLTTYVRQSSNIACHNFNTVVLVNSSILLAAASNFMDEAAELNIDVIREGIPPDWKIGIPSIKELQSQVSVLPSTTRKANLLKTNGILLEPNQTIKIPIKVSFQKATDKEVSIRILGSLSPLSAGKRTSVINGYTYAVRTKK